MSKVLEKDIKNFVYPTPFELHYSKEYDERYANDANYICGDSVDKDLAAHITIINHLGVCLCGKPINDVFGEVPERYYLRERVVSSKYEGGGRAKKILPGKYFNLIDEVINIYMSKMNNKKWNEEELTIFAEYMIKEITN